jgi:hypothetical protein
MAKQPEAAIGDLITGTCVTFGSIKTGRVTSVIGPIASPDCGGYRYRLTGTGQFYAGGGPVEPIVFFERRETPAGPADLRRIRTERHRAAMILAGREPRG